MKTSILWHNIALRTPSHQYFRLPFWALRLQCYNIVPTEHFQFDLTSQLLTTMPFFICISYEFQQMCSNNSFMPVTCLQTYHFR